MGWGEWFRGKLVHPRPEESHERDCQEPNWSQTDRGHPGAPEELDPRPHFHMDVYTNPLEMHKFFEQQMDDVFRTFGFHRGFLSGLGQEDGRLGSLLPPSGPQPDTNGGSHPGARDFMLKDGMGFTQPNSHLSVAGDQDLDSQVSEKGLAGIFGAGAEEPSAPVTVEPHPKFSFFFGSPHESGSGQSFSFSASSSQQTIRNPDGSVETRITRKDGHGNETSVVTRQFGDKSHTTTSVRKPDGSANTTETFDNTDADEMARWANPDRHGWSSPRLDEPRSFRSAPLSDEQSVFDKIFGQQS